MKKIFRWILKLFGFNRIKKTIEPAEPKAFDKKDPTIIIKQKIITRPVIANCRKLWRNWHTGKAY